MKAFAEFVGAFLFLLVIALVVGQGVVYAPFAIALALVALIYTFGDRSGAHLNPAVSIAMFVQKKITATELVSYVVAQIVAGVLAFTVGNYLTGEKALVQPKDGVDPIKALLVETLFGFMLVTVVFNVAASKKNANNPYFGLAIGLVILAGAFAGGGISGGSFNPAVSIASGLTGGILSNVWVGIVGPIIGGLVASFVWKAMEDAQAEG